MNYITFILNFLLGEPKKAFDIQKSYKPRIHIESNTIYALSYTNAEVRRLIKEMKYKRSEEAMRICADVLRGLVTKKDVILIPIPSHWIKRMIRGFNHMNKLVKLTNLEYVNILYWKKYIPSRAKSGSKRERMNTVKENMGLKRKLLNRIEGKTIIIVDDVVTTGDTINEAKRVLREYGITNILSISIAG